MRFKAWGRWTGVLVAILLVATMSLLLGRNESSATPSAMNTMPSGLAAFAELLTRDGYRTSIDRSDSPKLAPGDVVVAPCLVGTLLREGESQIPRRTETALKRFVKSGGRVLALEFERDFNLATSKAKSLQVTPWVGANVELKIDHGPPQTPQLKLLEDADPYELASVNSLALVEVRNGESGVVVRVANALGCTNRFLGRNDNAEYYLGLVHRIAPNGSRIVFLNSTMGDFDQTGLLGMFGGWAVAAQWQVVLLLVVVALTVGQRFGAAQREFANERGTRQLVDTLADIFRTSKKQQFSARLIVDQAIKRHRTRHRIPSATSDQAIVDTLGPEARAAYGRIVGTETKISPDDAIANLNIVLRAFESEGFHARRR